MCVSVCVHVSDYIHILGLHACTCICVHTMCKDLLYVQSCVCACFCVWTQTYVWLCENSISSSFRPGFLSGNAVCSGCKIPRCLTLFPGQLRGCLFPGQLRALKVNPSQTISYEREKTYGVNAKQETFFWPSIKLVPMMEHTLLRFVNSEPWLEEWSYTAQRGWAEQAGWASDMLL